MDTVGESVAVAIDFGATYSGISLIGVKSKRLVELGQWPGQPESSNSYKVPTTVVYQGDGKPPLWGFEAEKSTDNTYPKLRVFKPYLDPTLADKYRTPPKIKLNDVVHDYIHGLYTHLVRYIEVNGGFGSRPNLNFILTVPATFEESTIECFRKIIKTTGIGDHTFSVSLTEPEAAGLYTMKAMTMLDNCVCRLNDCFIVCDAGGGTVDLASYNIIQSSPIKVEHTGLISGDYCGSTIIDRRFISYIKDLIGEDVWRGLGSKADDVVKRFIAEKERFDNSEENFNILLGDIPCPGKKGQYLSIPRGKMLDFFDISIRGIQKMIDSHIDQCKSSGHKVSFIFLVGGLGSSRYTKKKVEEYCSEIDLDIRVIQPYDAQQAVIRGTISSYMQSLRIEEDPIQNRICRKSYGLLTSKTFSERNFEYEKVKDPISGEVLAKEQIDWLVQKGDRIRDGPERCIERVFVREFLWKSTERKSGWNEVLVAYSGDNMPYRVESESGVNKLCIITLKLPFRDFKKLGKDMGLFSLSLKYFQVKYTIRIYIGTVGVLRVELLYKGRLEPDLMNVSWVDERGR